MRIRQILNNNVVSVVDASGSEFILTGRGLGFNARVGDDVAQDKVEKTFTLDDATHSRFKVLIDEIPLDVIQLTDDIVRLAASTLGYKLSDGLYVSLADHLHYALERQKNNQEIINPLQWEVRHPQRPADRRLAACELLRQATAHLRRLRCILRGFVVCLNGGNECRTHQQGST
mgnify:CR=1 FL=1